MPRRGALLFALIAFLTGASLIREAEVGRLAKLDEAWAGLLARRTAPRAGPEPVTLVEVNEETLSRHPWPWGPDDFALFFHAVLSFEPAVIGLEPIVDFEHGSLAARERQPEYEKMLHDHVLRSPKLVLGGRLGWAQDSDVVPDLRPMPVLRKVTGDLREVPEFTDVAEWAAEDYRLTTQPGWTNLPDPGTPHDRCPLVLRYRGQPVPSIVLQLAMHFEKVTLDEVEVVLGSHVTIGRLTPIPIDMSGRMPVNFGARFGRVSFDEILMAREQIDRNEAPARPPDLFKGRVIVLAKTDAPSRTIPTAGSQKIAPGELFAAALSTLEAGAYPRRIATWFDWALVGAAAIAAMTLRRWKPLFACIGALVILAAYAWVATSVFHSRLLILPAVLPVGLVLCVLLLRLAARKIERIIAF